MKKVLLCITLINVCVNAQVGVQTENPKETLDVKGTLRVQELPEDGSGKIYDGQATKNTNFKATRNVLADDKGNLGYEVVTDQKSVKGFANRCIKGYFDRNDVPNPMSRQQAEQESEITVDGISVRYSPDHLALASKIQLKSNVNDKILYRPVPGAAFTSVGPGKGWVWVRNFNYSEEFTTIGIITLTERGKMYRYSAQAWKETGETPPGFCHHLEVIGEWDGNLNP